MAYYWKTFAKTLIPEQHGKIFVITGGATGIGFAVALALLEKDAVVYIAARSREKFDVAFAQASEKLGTEWPGEKRFKFLKLNLGSIRESVQAAKELVTLENRLDCVIANAAVSVVPCTLTEDGYEIQFATNHLGHFAFITTLLPFIIRSSLLPPHDTRIVILASHAHSMVRCPSGIDFSSLSTPIPNDMTSVAAVPVSLQRYARSKLANILFARELQRRLDEDGGGAVRVNCVNPGTAGSSGSNFGSEEAPGIPRWFKLVTGSLVMLTKIPAESAALTPLLLATDGDVVERDVRGQYFDVGPVAGKFWYGYSWEAEGKLSAWARDEALGRRLWEWSEEAVEKAMGGKGG